MCQLLLVRVIILMGTRIWRYIDILRDYVEIIFAGV